MYNELFNFNGSIDKKKPAAQLKQQAFHQIKNTKEFRLRFLMTIKLSNS